MAWQWHTQETFKGLVALAVELLKALALVNGGAAVALLTYAGNLVSHAPGAHMPHLKRALLCYCFGLFATVFAFMAAYFTQLRLYEEERDRHAGKPVRQLHGIGIRIGAAFALIAAFAFLFGCLYAASALKKAGTL